jgi:hypothetical protein
MSTSLKLRRTITALIVVGVSCIILLSHPDLWQPVAPKPPAMPASTATGSAAAALEKLPVKGRAPKTNYSRAQFGDGWASTAGCDTRNIILHRDMTNVVENSSCQVVSGVLNDPYTGKIIQFSRGGTSSAAVQIDHVVALSNAWQTGAQQLTPQLRQQLANDPLELLAVDGPANQQKSDGDAATWLPSNKPFRCQYVARQIAVKAKYSLWVTSAEKDAIIRILGTCPNQPLPTA